VDSVGLANGGAIAKSSACPTATETPVPSVSGKGGFPEVLAAVDAPGLRRGPDGPEMGNGDAWGFRPVSYASNGIPSVSSVASAQSRSLAEQVRMYQQDQLLAHPGGDYYDLSAADPRLPERAETSCFDRIGKDVRDALANVGNFFKDLVGGSSYRYVDDDGQVRTAQRRGLLGNVLEFFKDAASGLSFGLFRPDGEPEPQGLWERLKFAAHKLVGEAIVDDLVFGVPSAAINVVDDAVLAAWNLLEVVPDATIGSIPGGEEVVTTIFDNGQVLIDYVTDCLPTAEAWMRVHAYELDGEAIVPPVLYNLRLPERYAEDSRWSTVRNTPFRRSIETVGSLLADALLANFTIQGMRTSKRRQ
jgi:hypothetical protein